MVAARRKLVLRTKWLSRVERDYFYSYCADDCHLGVMTNGESLETPCITWRLLLATSMQRSMDWNWGIENHMPEALYGGVYEGCSVLCMKFEMVEVTWFPVPPEFNSTTEQRRAQSKEHSIQQQ
ncbi:hypothetical protein SNOG_12162 [Parastagonospora nodorum SN15]|uniref:Uncharacterized protein n=1 Tax=Phaeosphaeria nodorum (strain SN15 / ATCC MYA-4574 / FGSC 10173) TaxID=321614 RepID=Q0U7V2_PHANO|nr:hypothetical protein SNOG_12162 [Parastagonospora nodorum SN15]EAT80574.1 hypothetical protein SNOG_12162 [Parastagonospora nodorum SN15]